jgi:hypothetical protein
LDVPNIIYFSAKQGTLNEEANCTEPSPSVSVPWLLTRLQQLRNNIYDCAAAKGKLFFDYSTHILNDKA